MALSGAAAFLKIERTPLTQLVTALNSALHLELMAIEPVLHNGKPRYPCAVTLQDGRFLECVYLVPYSSLSFGGSDWIPTGEIASIHQSPARLAGRFASEIRAYGESGNGYYTFTLLFSWWRRKKYLTSVVDFVKYPPFTGPNAVRGLEPGGVFQLNAPTRDLKIHWCAFMESANPSS